MLELDLNKDNLESKSLKKNLLCSDLIMSNRIKEMLKEIKEHHECDVEHVNNICEVENYISINRKII